MDLEVLGMLIFQELKLIREDMKQEIRKLGKDIKLLHCGNIDTETVKLEDFNEKRFGSESDALCVSLYPNREKQDQCNKVDGEKESDALLSLSKNNSYVFELEIPNSDDDKNNCSSDYSRITNDKNELIVEVSGYDNSEIGMDTNPSIVNVKSVDESNINLNFSADRLLNKSITGTENSVDNVENNSNDFNTCHDKDLMDGLINSYVSDVSPTNTKSVESRNDFICPFCSKSFAIYSKYYFHLLMHTDDKDFSYKIAQVSPEKCHNTKPFACEYCGNRFALKKALKTHVCALVDGNPFSYAANVESRTGENFADQHQHMFKKSRLYTCNYCGENFAFKSRLDDHLHCHAGKKPFKCNICSKTFTRSGSLNQHQLLHKSIKPFTCKYCNKGFTRRDYLVVHLRSHTGEKPFSCSLCSKSFAKKSCLNAHINVHSKKNQFPCPICNKCFSKQKSLDEHLTIHTNEEELRCDICEKSYKNRTSFLNHKKLHHS